MYCIYTDTDVPDDAGNLDHIIPLSLGGRDQFTVWSNKDFNSRIGGAVDGAMANDSLLQIVRSRSPVRGHSSNQKSPTWKNARISGRPGQMVWTPDGMKLWDARERRHVENEGDTPIPVTAQIHLDMFTATRFAAKVALGGAYFIYGDAIRKAVDCDVLRKLIALNPEAARGDKHLLSSGIHVCDRMHPDSQNGEGAVHRAFCEFTNRSVFIAVPHVDGITLSCGLLGTFIGTIILPGDGSNLHNDTDQHDLGHAIILGPGSIERMSYRELAAKFYRVVYGKEPPAPPI